MKKVSKIPTSSYKTRKAIRILKKIIGLLGGIGGIIGLLLAIYSIIQARHEGTISERANATLMDFEQNQIDHQKTDESYQGTQVALTLEIKDLQQEMIQMLVEIQNSLEDNSADYLSAAPTATALYEQYAQLQATKESLREQYTNIVTPSPSPLSTPSPATFDIVLAFDISASMYRDNSYGASLAFARDLSEYLLMTKTNNRVGIITFGSEARIIQPLTAEFFSILDSLDKIYDSYPSESTLIFHGLNLAYDMLGQPDNILSRPINIEPIKAIILFSDGVNAMREGNIEELNLNTIRIAELIKSDEGRIAVIFPDYVTENDEIHYLENFWSSIVSPGSLYTNLSQLSVETMLDNFIQQ